MITERDGDLLAQPDLSHIAHQANLFHTFGAGLARQIAQRYPHGLLADQLTRYGDVDKLGTFSIGEADDEGPCDGPCIVNLYTQDGFGESSTDYVAMREALIALEAKLAAYRPLPRLGLPHGLGCGLAGGDWQTVRGIIDDVFARSPLEVVICRLPERA